MLFQHEPDLQRSNGTPSHGVGGGKEISAVFCSLLRAEAGKCGDGCYVGPVFRGGIQVCPESLLQIDNTLRAGSFMDDSIIPQQGRRTSAVAFSHMRADSAGGCRGIFLSSIRRHRKEA